MLETLGRRNDPRSKNSLVQRRFWHFLQWGFWQLEFLQHAFRQLDQAVASALESPSPVVSDLRVRENEPFEATAIVGQSISTSDSSTGLKTGTPNLPQSHFTFAR